MIKLVALTLAAAALAGCDARPNPASASAPAVAVSGPASTNDTRGSAEPPAAHGPLKLKPICRDKIHTQYKSQFYELLVQVTFPNQLAFGGRHSMLLDITCDVADQKCDGFRIHREDFAEGMYGSGTVLHWTGNITSWKRDGRTVVLSGRGLEITAQGASVRIRDGLPNEPRSQEAEATCDATPSIL